LRLKNYISGWLVLLLLVTSLQATTQPRSKHKKLATTASKSTTAKGSKRHLKHARLSRSWKRHGQQTVDGRRTEQIQQALIQSHYLDGEPSGAWDTRTQEALRRYQAANGWQSKVVPDSRALIKLGLGPSTEKLLNPESAMTVHVDKTPSVAPVASSDPNSPR
jgi:peptidoglycan hydrolase-like protein with peptidoglycan-binding domain